ncbi:predicted protein [Postia placenta Mad-698-R]|nr:predicted protein [Postia placenta Mad-698-R]
MCGQCPIVKVNSELKRKRTVQYPLPEDQLKPLSRWWRHSIGRSSSAAPSAPGLTEVLGQRLILSISAIPIIENTGMWSTARAIKGFLRLGCLLVPFPKSTTIKRHATDSEHQCQEWGRTVRRGGGNHTLLSRVGRHEIPDYYKVCAFFLMIGAPCGHASVTSWASRPERMKRAAAGGRPRKGSDDGHKQ